MSEIDFFFKSQCEFDFEFPLNVFTASVCDTTCAVDGWSSSALCECSNAGVCKWARSKVRVVFCVTYTDMLALAITFILLRQEQHNSKCARVCDTRHKALFVSRLLTHTDTGTHRHITITFSEYYYSFTSVS